MPRERVIKVPVGEVVRIEAVSPKTPTATVEVPRRNPAREKALASVRCLFKGNEQALRQIEGGQEEHRTKLFLDLADEVERVREELRKARLGRKAVVEEVARLLEDNGERSTYAADLAEAFCRFLEGNS